MPTQTTTPTRPAMQGKPKNNPRTGHLDHGPQGITFAAVTGSPMEGQYAYAPTGGSTRWFSTYEEAWSAFVGTVEMKGGAK